MRAWRWRRDKMSENGARLFVLRSTCNSRRNCSRNSLQSTTVQSAFNLGLLVCNAGLPCKLRWAIVPVRVKAEERTELSKVKSDFIQAV